METTTSFSASPKFLESFATKAALLQSRRAEMPEGSTTARLFSEGYPKIIAKSTEELGETIQAFLEQDDTQVNIEASQFIYYLMVSVALSGKGSIDQIIRQFQAKRARRTKLPETLGLGFRELSESAGKAYAAFLSGVTNGDAINDRVANALLGVDNLIAITRKGSWEGILKAM